MSPRISHVCLRLREDALMVAEAQIMCHFRSNAQARFNLDHSRRLFCYMYYQALRLICSSCVHGVSSPFLLTSFTSAPLAVDATSRPSSHAVHYGNHRPFRTHEHAQVTTPSPTGETLGNICLRLSVSVGVIASARSLFGSTTECSDRRHCLPCDYKSTRRLV
jgi:hypothetical protein